MRRAQSSKSSWLVTAVTVGLLAVGLMAFMNHRSARAQPGETWRRGMLSGDQIRLLDDKRYVLSRWCYVCSDEVIESGTWAQLGEVVSLVPYRSGQSPRLMREIARDGERFLADPGGSDAPSEEAMFVLIN